MSQPTQQPRALARVLGQWDLIALTVNGVIASGIYFLPSTIAGLTGPFSPFAYLICALITLIFVLSFAEVSSRFDAAGGPYLYAYEAYGKFVGFEIGWIAYLTRLSAVAANYNLFIIYLGHFFPSATSGVLRATVLFTLIAMFTVINIRGVKYGAWTVDVITVAKLLPLLLLILVGLSSIDTGNISIQEVPPYEGFMRAMFLLTFSYGGFEIVTIPSGESVDPKRHVPRALILALVIVAVFYFLVQIVAVGVLPSLATQERPIAAVASTLMGNFGGNLVAFGALLSTFGYFSGSILGVPRLTFALAEKKQLPAAFAKIHPRFQTPYISILFYSVLAFLLAVFSNFITLAAVSVVSRLLYYITTSGAVFVFRRQSKAPFTIPLGPVIPIAGIAFALYLLQYPKLEEVYFAAGGIAIGTVLYFFVKRNEKK
ncbi:MAG TPA: amino acid permease [Bacteroidota bacterium]